MDTIIAFNTRSIYLGTAFSIYNMFGNKNQACLFCFQFFINSKNNICQNLSIFSFSILLFFFRTAEVCTHITGMLFLLSEYIASSEEFPEEKSCTDRKCWWVEQRCKLDFNALNLCYLIPT